MDFEINKELEIKPTFKKTPIAEAVNKAIEGTEEKSHKILLGKNNNSQNQLIKENSVDLAIENLIKLVENRNQGLTIITANEDIKTILELEINDYFQNNQNHDNIKNKIKCEPISSVTSLEKEGIIAFFDLSMFRGTKKMKNIIKENKDKQIVGIGISHSYMGLTELSKSLGTYDHIPGDSLKELSNSENNGKFSYEEAENEEKLIDIFLKTEKEGSYLGYVDDKDQSEKIIKEFKKKGKKAIFLDAKIYNDIDSDENIQNVGEETDIYLVPKELAGYITFKHSGFVIFGTLNNDQLIKAGQAGIIDKAGENIEVIDCPREVYNFQKQQLVNLLGEKPLELITEATNRNNKTKGGKKINRGIPTSTMPGFMERLETIGVLGEKTDSDEKLIDNSKNELENKDINDIVELLYLSTKDLKELIYSISPLKTYLKRYKIKLSNVKGEVLESLGNILGLEYKDKQYYKEKVKEFLSNKGINSEKEALKRTIKNGRGKNKSTGYRSFINNPYLKYYCKEFLGTEISQISEKNKITLINKIFGKNYRTKLKGNSLSKFQGFGISDYSDLLLYKYKGLKQISDLRDFINNTEEIVDFYNTEKGLFLEDDEKYFPSTFKIDYIPLLGKILFGEDKVNNFWPDLKEKAKIELETGIINILSPGTQHMGIPYNTKEEVKELSTNEFKKIYENSLYIKLLIKESVGIKNNFSRINEENISSIVDSLELI